MPAALIGFLVMSFADGIGVATSRLNAAFGFSPAVMGILPSLVFLWFFVLSLPVGGLCARCGRKRVALISLLLTAFALVLPMGAGVSPSAVFVVSFGLLGIANVGLQVALPPLVASVSPSKAVAGRVMACLAVKTGTAAAIPLVFAAAAGMGSWMAVFPVGAAFALCAAGALARLPALSEAGEGSSVSFFGALKLLADPLVLTVVAAFALAICQDVWLNLALPGLLRSFYGWDAARQGLGASVYFLAKIPAMLLGAIVLPRMRPSALALPCVAAVAVGIVSICLAPPVVLFFAALVLVSFGSANFYGIAFGLLAERHPDDLDRLSSLLVMSISSAALVAPVLTFCGWRF